MASQYRLQAARSRIVDRAACDELRELVQRVSHDRRPPIDQTGDPAAVRVDEDLTVAQVGVHQSTRA
ncbi:hypothetical protein FB566_0052 [Stackebrandtia endophytica]|uniref:Uncharacterized protein n=1 Tax=Stackebrandtia endophytica TaxID=1496996 RepID=A0A543APR2_9ACTN|nr:hypothetical protein [Stackebrandtia endophytica]TQL74567.1 hypothetical protein FB566_0052 [Stackebrandtia endophytica]